MAEITVKKILVTLDGSETAESVLPYVRSLVASFGSKVDVLGSAVGRKDRRLNRLLEDYINSTAVSLQNEGIKAEPVILYGDAPSKILEHADKNRVDLIVMATHGRSGISLWWMGSVAEKVISVTKKPMLLVPSKDKTGKDESAEKVTIEKIVVALDGSDTGQAALPYVEALAKKTGASVSLIQVIPSPGTMDPSIPGGPYWIKFVEAVNDSAQEYLNDVAKKLTKQGIQTTCKVMNGDSAYRIVEHAEQENASLIAMSTHGRTGIARWVLGSVTDKVMHSAKMPIWIVRPSKMVISAPKS